MNWPYELQIGWRYTRVGRAGRRNAFISFISGVSMFGIALGVAALIIVLSVMNGFRKEVQDRMLSVISHVEVVSADGNALPDWQATVATARQNPQVIGAAPFVAAQALIVRGDEPRGAIVRGISPNDEATVTDVAARLKDTVFARLVPGQWGVVLGIELARTLGVRDGDKVTIVLPGGQVTPAGVVPRLKQLTVVGTFDAVTHPQRAGQLDPEHDTPLAGHEPGEDGVLQSCGHVGHGGFVVRRDAAHYCTARLVTAHDQGLRGDKRSRADDLRVLTRSGDRGLPVGQRVAVG